MKRGLGQTIHLDDGEDADHDFLSQVADVEARALSSKTTVKRVKPSFATAADAREVKPQVKGAYLAALRGEDTSAPWPKQQSKFVGAGSRVKVVAGDGTNASGGDNACFKCGKLGHWARDCDSAPVGGGTQSSELQKACPCGLGDCLVLTANTEKNKGRRFYKCPVREENGGCGFFEWCDNDSGAAYMPNMSSDSRSSSQFPDLLCPCGAGSCLILTAKKGNNVGQQFYKCPANQGSSCGYFKWCNDHTAVASLPVASLPASADKVHNSFNYTGSKGYGTTSGSSCFKCGKEGHWAKDCSLPAPDYSSVLSAGKVHNSFNYEGSKSYVATSGSSCFNCGKEGHWSKDCSLLAPDNSSASSAGKVYNSFNYGGSKSYDTTSGSSYFKGGKERHWAKDYSLPAPDYSSASSAGKVYNSFNYGSSKSYGTSGSSYFKGDKEGHWAKDCPLPAPDYSTSIGTGKSSSPGSRYKGSKAGYSAKDCLPSNTVVKWERQ
ncbi:uncharacterized protein LOC115752528 [Rhodamnia argentea]|uniref:Uncharacterized protein LOC115752528 n=1 Tax=Rhodamnia argentea TaxID=178133 RepID=A0ABM3HR81_9MYRT|nr:uncharacterized protein LOC115752528 [Rhodamnia argentea]XP_048139103.1 uncharacterized protein LOC115752528 [Rhodamnia argentea]